jgi:RNA polymerase sigma-70 factor (ECF subfamily)
MAVFERLSAGEREVLALAAWEELSSSAIAEVLGCSPNAARIRLHRARRRFARGLATAGVRVDLRPGPLAVQSDQGAEELR